jgi:hypothetical protein
MGGCKPEDSVPPGREGCTVGVRPRSEGRPLAMGEMDDTCGASAGQSVFGGLDADCVQAGCYLTM